jgi:signal transduction histidine kinase
MSASEVADLGTGIVLVAAGVLALARPAGRPTGVLLCATGGAWLAGSAVEALVFLHRGPLVQLLLAYPRARVAGRPRRAVVGAAYVTGIVEPLGASEVAASVLCALVVAATGARWWRAGGIERRAAGSAVVAAVVLCGALVGAAIARAAGVDADRALAVYEAAVALVAVGLAGDVVLGGWARGVITGLMLDVGRLERAAPLGEAIGRAVGDRSLVIAYRAGPGWVDEAGRELVLPAPGDRSRSVLFVREGDTPVAAVVHDPGALTDPGLAHATVATTRLAVGNVRLDESVARRVAELEASARRLVNAGDGERRRLAGVIEDGPVRRIAGVAGRLAGADAELALATREALGDIQAFAAGVRPPRLAGEGLAGALDDLARGAGVPVALRVSRDRFGDTVEVTMYFVCSEALANVAKHAGARTVEMAVTRRDGHVVAEVADDGAGGASIARGSGLRGLADRVEALGGRLVVVSPPAAGTMVRAEIPV